MNFPLLMAHILRNGAVTAEGDPLDESNEAFAFRRCVDHVAGARNMRRAAAGTS
jgi:hypothetical protein